MEKDNLPSSGSNIDVHVDEETGITHVKTKPNEGNIPNKSNPL